MPENANDPLALSGPSTENCPSDGATPSTSNDNRLSGKSQAWIYAARGWHVFPVHTPTPDGGCSCLDPKCSSPGKHPRTTNGHLDASTDPATIKRWWQRWPSANIGIACGPSGLVVIDLDGDEGLDTWADLRQRHGIDDGGAIVSMTGGGGQHLLFAAPDGVDIRNSTGNNDKGLGVGVDVRANGGYIVAPPSVHPSGKTYTWDIWEVSRHPDDHELSPLPAPLLALLVKGNKSRAETLPERIQEGQRNTLLISLAGSMRRRGASEAGILAALLVENEQRCDPQLDEDEVMRIASSGSRYAPETTLRTARMGRRISKRQAEGIEAVAPEPPDLALRDAIKAALLGEGEDKLDKWTRRQVAGALLLDWLEDNGGFVQSETGDRFYFHRPDRRLYRLDSERWIAWLFSLTGVYPATVDFSCLRDECNAVAMDAPRQPVVRVAAWDGDVLRVSRFDGTVFVLDGDTISEEPNGENALFDDDPLWLSYTPDYSSPGALEWSTWGLPNWERDGKEHGLAFRAWVLSSFFTELCPSRPLLVFLGEKGSGKSMALRVLLRLMFGPIAQVSGVPDKPDGFTAAAGASHLLVLDNLDQFTGWLRDKLARIATGANDQYRRLYTSNEVGHVIYRCWLAFTARTPDTLRRDDLADRLLLLPVVRIGDGDRKRESDLFEQAATLRNLWWGDVLTALNRAVGSVHRGDLYGPSRLRMADWEAIGRVFAQNEGKRPTWNRFVEGLKRSQSDFLLEGSLIAEGLDAWLADDANHEREVTAKELHQELGYILFGDKKTPSDWPKSARGFGMRLSGIWRDLRTYFHVERAKVRGNRIVYRFSPMPEG